MRDLTTGILKDKLRVGIICAVCMLLGASLAWGQSAAEPNSAPSGGGATGVSNPLESVPTSALPPYSKAPTIFIITPNRKRHPRRDSN
jgi:hypothetical protein